MIPHVSIRAFVHSPTASAAVERALADRHLARAQGEILSGGIAAAVAHYRAHVTPDVLIVEVERDVLAELPALAEVCDTRTLVLVIGQTNDVTLYKCVMQLGVSDYLVAPVDAVGVVASLRGLYEDGRQATKGKTYAFIPSKGGAGSSVISHNVAWLMAAREEKPVMLADLDMAFGAASLALDVRTQHKLTDVMQDAAQMDTALLDRLLIARGKHLQLLAPSAALAEAELPAASLRKLVELARDGFRNTVLDLPGAWSPTVKEALLMADDVVVTAQPDLISLRNTRALLDFLVRSRPNDPAPKLVLNQVGQRKRPELAPAAFVEALQFKPTVIVRSDPAVFGKAVNTGQTIPEIAPRSAASRELAKLSRELLGTEGAQKLSRRFSFRRG
ncbi:AAA family ATPase [Rhodobacteraceae bacterium 2376]|uniref:AAA family ATPase n=1 Tax=Rhabdonatronobacter sediminivivens TaxID=2743469 RepID=A0A7Z0I058_9RHOB|nr:AAA family ATPase [Rhabdonatronobacter sediminivivens]NYS25496.1 AAA family ATPase [Rhabdonatronobacter sediminivivens]